MHSVGKHTPISKGFTQWKISFQRTYTVSYCRLNSVNLNYLINPIMSHSNILETLSFISESLVTEKLHISNGGI